MFLLIKMNTRNLAVKNRSFNFLGKFYIASEIVIQIIVIRNSNINVKSQLKQLIY